MKRIERDLRARVKKWRALLGRQVPVARQIVTKLLDGRLVSVCLLSLPGFGFYLTHRADHPRLPLIATFGTWLRNVVVPAG